MLFNDFTLYLEEYFSIRSYPIISKKMPSRIGSYKIIKYANPGYGSPPGFDDRTRVAIRMWIELRSVCGFDPETHEIIKFHTESQHKLNSIKL